VEDLLRSLFNDRLLRQHGRWFTEIVPGARIAGRTQKTRVYALTAFPTPTNAWKLGLWREFHTAHSNWAIAAEEEAPTTGRLHQHWVFHLTDAPETSFITALFPEFHFEGIPEDAPRRIQKAIEYATKGGNIVFSSGTVPQALPAIRRTESDLRWEQILTLTEAGNTRQVRALFPKECARNFTHLEMLAARAAFARRPRETLEDRELLRKNLYIWGDSWTGKSFWCNHIAGENAILKKQNKWWEGSSSEDPPTGIIWGDLQQLLNFNW
jgi:hypothetical protein